MSTTALATRLANLADADPDRPIIIQDSVVVTRAELDRRTNRLARVYAALGVGAGELVTIALANDVEFYDAVWATWKLGAVPSPVSHRLPDSELRAIIDLADPALVVGLKNGVDAVGGRPVIPPGYRPAAGTSDAPLPIAISPSWKAPTSGGSTGRPKLIVSGDPATAEAITALGRVLRMQVDGTTLVTGPLYHNGPLSMSIASMLLGGTQVLMSHFDAEQSLALIAAHGIDWMYAVPTMLHRIWRLPTEVRTSYDLTSLAVVMHMAAPCPAWLKKEWIDWLGPGRIWELYGGTEGHAFTLIGGTDWMAHPGSVGQVGRGELRILSENGDDVPAGEVGEVWMRRGAGLANPYTYIGAQARSIGDGWESLGDMGWLDEDGYLYLTDRRADMILVGGANVYPAEVEAALDAHAEVVSSCVIGLPDDDLGSVPHAIVQTSGPVSDEELLAHLRSRLVRYKLPRSFERVDEPLRDDAGKVRRSALRDERIA